MIKQLQEELTRKDQKIKEQKAKIKILQQKLRRNSNKMDNMNTLISDMKERQLLEPSVADQLDKHFHHLSKDIIINQFVNQDRSNKGHRHSDEVKKFALTVHFYSPRAYDYLRSIFTLPHPRCIKSWISTVNCGVGFFRDVFAHLQNLIADDPAVNGDSALIFDGMAIKKETPYNPTKVKLKDSLTWAKGLSMAMTTQLHPKP
jgi:hypothetical protein